MLQTDRLEELGDGVDGAEADALIEERARERADLPMQERDHDERGDREAHPEVVRRGDRLDEIPGQVERRAPDRCDDEQDERGETGHALRRSAT